MITALVLALLVRWAGFFVGGKAQTSAFWVPLMYVPPIVGALVPACFILANRSMELPTERAEKIAALVETLRARTGALAARLNVFRRQTAVRRP